MRTVWQSLVWKEWHEHKWQLAALAAVLSSIAMAAILLESNAQDSLLGWWTFGRDRGWRR